jgi:hypothetical protein
MLFPHRRNEEDRAVLQERNQLARALELGRNSMQCFEETGFYNWYD